MDTMTAGKVLRFGVILALLLLPSLCFAQTANTTTKFETGPFAGSFESGKPCYITTKDPIQSEFLDGTKFTDFTVFCCKGVIGLRKYDTKDNYISAEKAVRSDLINAGFDSAITIEDRQIDGHQGAIGKGYSPKEDAVSYSAFYQISPRSSFMIAVFSPGNPIYINDENYIDFLSILKTIHITERGQ
jgi:hypothetical protein